MHRLVPQFILDNYAAGKTHGGFPAVGLFVDISGFSTMTDALMVHGQHGAEVLAGVMRAAFEPLFRSVYEQRGFIAAQAGDAFTALFPLENSVTGGCWRAVAAAWHIQQRTDAQKWHTTPYGEFTISAKAGLALGEAIWGIPTSETGQRAAYYFQGTAIDECAEAEHQAQGGEIVLDTGLAAQLQGLISTERAGSFLRLVSLSTDLPDPQPAALPEMDLELAKHFYPRELLTQRSSGEFRQVVNLFISLPTVRTEAQLGIFMTSLFALQERYGGLINGVDFGDKGSNLLLFWGAPVAYENDIERTLNFILELQTQTTIPINGGVTYRVAHAGFIGSDLCEEYTAYGRGVNLAARFMTAAPRGEIWVDEDVAGRAKGQYDLDYIGEKTFKGFSQPQKVYRLFERKERIEQIYDYDLVGRKKELEQLADFVQPIFAGRYPGMLVVWGEPGIGKSRLVHEFLLRLAETDPDNFQVFLAQTDEILRDSLNPFRYWLRNYFGVSGTQVEARNKRSFNRKMDELIAATQDARLADELDRTRSFLGALVGLYWPDSLYEQLDAQGRYENTFTGLVTLLQAESRQRPVIFFLEDVHWLDEDSKTFLPRLMRVLTAEHSISNPVAILATARFEGAGLPLEGFPFQHIDLGQLSREPLAELCSAYLGGPAGESLLNLLAERSEGNPFFAEQILRYLKEENLLIASQNGWKVKTQRAGPLPLQVSAVLVARLDRLAQEVKEVVQTAAVLGREFEVSLLAQMLHEDAALPERLIQAEQAAIWFALSEFRYIFKHALLREAVYYMLLRARRQALHTLAVETFEKIYADHPAQQRYSELAFHAERAGMADKARRYFQLAGKTAQEAYQNSLAVEYYSRALALTAEDDLDSRYELLVAREAVFELMGEKDRRRQDVASLEKLALEQGDPGKKALVALRRANFAFDIGDSSQAIQLAESAVKTAMTAQAVDTVITAYGLLSIIHLRQNKLDLAAQHAERGLELSSETRDRLNEGRFLNYLGMIAIDRQNLTRARSCFEQSLQIAQEVGNLRAQAVPLNNLGMIANYQGDFPAGLEYYERSLAIARKIGVRAGEGIVLGNLGWIAGNLGEYRKARDYAEQTLQITREIGDLYSEVFSLINLSSFNVSLGDCAIALQFSEQASGIARRTGDRSAEAWAQLYQGHSLFALGQLQKAAEAYQYSLEIRQELGQPVLSTEPLAGLARTALARGDSAQAKNHLDAILRVLDGSGTLDGTDEPMRVYLTCYLVLQDTGDQRAGDVLETAYHLLHERAANIPDEAVRQAYLRNVLYHREILSAWEGFQTDRSPSGTLGNHIKRTD